MPTSEVAIPTTLDEVVSRVSKDIYLRAVSEEQSTFQEVLALFVTIFTSVKDLDPNSDAYVQRYDVPIDALVKEHVWLSETVSGVLVWHAFITHIRGKEPTYGASIRGKANFKSVRY